MKPWRARSVRERASGSLLDGRHVRRGSARRRRPRGASALGKTSGPLSLREVPTTPAPVVAQVWRSGSRQPLLARVVVGSNVEPMNDDQARAVGVLAGRAGATDVVDATVVEGALRRHDIVITSDPDDLKAIADSANRRLEVERP